MHLSFSRFFLQRKKKIKLLEDDKIELLGRLHLANPPFLHRCQLNFFNTFFERFFWLIIHFFLTTNYFFCHFEFFFQNLIC